MQNSSSSSRANARLRRAVSDLTLDKLILAEAAKGNF
jgi:putative transposase